MHTDFKHIATQIRADIEELLLGVGILCRVFGRGKDSISLLNKLQRIPNKYSLSGKHIQDAVGIRVALYFLEDIDIVKQILCSKFAIDLESSTIDIPKTDQFTVTRYNLIFKIHNDFINSFSYATLNQPIDNTFEVQLRSILSEGWHEVEHDLRYKSQEGWKDQDDLNRALNGVFATLETSEWSMNRIFDDLAYRHYKTKNWTAMLQNTLKMRVSPELSKELLEVFNANPEIGKNFLRIDRKKLLSKISIMQPKLPITMNNIVYLWNFLVIQDGSISNLTPPLLIENFSNSST